MLRSRISAGVGTVDPPRGSLDLAAWEPESSAPGDAFPGASGSAAAVDSDPSSRPARAGETQLALFLMLAGFFAVLLSLAQPEPDRARMVLESLAATFSEAYPPEADIGEGGPPRPGQGRRYRRARLPLGEPLTAAERRAGLLARVRIAEDRLFDASGGIPRWRWFLLGRLARRVADDAEGHRRLEILLPAAALSEGDATALRVRTLLGRLTAFGAPVDRVALGMLPAGRGLWTFVLRELPGESAS